MCRCVNLTGKPIVNLVDVDVVAAIEVATPFLQARDTRTTVVVHLLLNKSTFLLCIYRRPMPIDAPGPETSKN